MRIRKKTKHLLLTFIALGVIILSIGVVYVFLESPKIEDTHGYVPQKEVEEPIKKVQIIDLDSDSRPYAVMINNNKSVWKYQSGLNDAYIIYEMLVEGGITREMALFKDVSNIKIQSIRSSRHYFLDYVLENDAIYVHWGQSERALEDIKSLKIDNINGLYYENTYFFRDNTIPSNVGKEHKGYTTMDYLLSATSKLGYTTTTTSDSLLSYSADSVDVSIYSGVVDASYIEVPYSSGYKAKFYYDEETKLYKRSQNNTELIDYTTNERLTIKNIIVYSVGYTEIDSYGRLDMDNIGSGSGYFISEGKAVPITWEKSKRNSKTIYKYEDGTILTVNDGSTYIGIEPTGRSPLIEDTIPS